MSSAAQISSATLDRIHAKAVLMKNECFFVGFIEGIFANNRLDEMEVEPLLAECAALCELVQDTDAAEVLEEARQTPADRRAELDDLLRNILDIRAQAIARDCPRSSANRLLGLCAGVNCDGRITHAEAVVLRDRLGLAHDLMEDPRVQTLEFTVRDALEDGHLDPDEASEVSKLITALVGDSYADTGIASSFAVPVIHDLDPIDEETFEGASIVLTGSFESAPRAKVGQSLEALGALIAKSVSATTRYVIVGGKGSPHYTHKSHGTTLAKALDLRARGISPRIYQEAQLRGVLNGLIEP
ncbi:MAG: BRCT domain-containing protein [Shimia sp.]